MIGTHPAHFSIPTSILIPILRLLLAVRQCCNSEVHLLVFISLTPVSAHSLYHAKYHPAFRDMLGIYLYIDNVDMG